MIESSLALIYKARPTQREVPATLKEREDLRQIVTAYVLNNKLCAPLGINELKHHATGVLKEHNLSAQYADFAAVLISNALWRETVAAIPYNAESYLSVLFIT